MSCKDLFDLPTQLVVLILKSVDSLEDIHSFGQTCRQARVLLQTCESRELWTNFCPGSARSLKLALSYYKLRKLLERGGIRPKPATFYYRFQPRKGVGLLDKEKHVVPLNSERIFNLVNFLNMLSLGSIPCSYCPYFTLVTNVQRNSKGTRLCFLVYSEDTSKCLYEAELGQASGTDDCASLISVSIHRSLVGGGSITACGSSPSRAVMTEKVESLIAILMKVYYLNRERSDMLGKISVLHEGVEMVGRLSATCGIKQFNQEKCKRTEKKNSSEVGSSFLVSVRMDSPNESGHPRHLLRKPVTRLYSACEQIKDVQKYLIELKPQHLESLVIHCYTPKEAKQYKRIIQSMVDHAFLLNPELKGGEPVAAVG